MNTSPSLTYIFSSCIELTRTCHQKCGYCSFFREEAPLLSIEELKAKATQLAEQKATEVTLIAGESPQEYPHIQIELHRSGFSSFYDYLLAACNTVIEAKILPVLSIGYVNEFVAEKFAQAGAIFRVNLVSESLSKEGQALEKARGRNPSSGKTCIESLHNAQIPYSVGFVIGIGEKEDSRLNFITEIGRFCTADPYLQDIRIIPFQPTPDCAMPDRPPLPFVAVEKAVKQAKEAFPVHPISVPPWLFYRFPDLVDAGLNDLGSVPILTGDPSAPGFEIPGYENLKARLEKANLMLFERCGCSTPAARNRTEIAEILPHTQKLIDRRNASRLNLIDDERCFVCGKKNDFGFHIPMREMVNDHICTFKWTPGPNYQGYAGIVHGGILSTLLDEAMAWAVMNNERMAVTADIRVKFIRPTPVGLPLKVVATRVGQRKNLHFARASVLLPDGTVSAQAEGRFAEI